MRAEPEDVWATMSRQDRQRLDKWIWFARLAKTRTLSAKLVASGFVRVNGQRVETPAKPLAIGDVVTVALGRTTLVLRVEGLGSRRGGQDALHGPRPRRQHPCSRGRQELSATARW